MKEINETVDPLQTLGESMERIVAEEKLTGVKFLFDGRSIKDDDIPYGLGMHERKINYVDIVYTR